MKDIVILMLILLGGYLISGFKIPRLNMKKKLGDALQYAAALQEKEKPQTAKEYVNKINGTSKENFVRRSVRESKTIYETIGQSEQYNRVLIAGGCSSLLGVIIGLMLHNWMLSIVLAMGLYFLPMWLTRFQLYRYQQYLSEELETALSLITTSYMRSGDILGAVEENIPHIHEPLKTAFTVFSNNVRYVDSNIAAQIQKMKDSIDNSLFAQWCDVLILCQDNHQQMDALTPIVNKFSVLKEQQQANSTRMMLPLRQAISMIILVLSFCPIMAMVNHDWYYNLTHTFMGQFSLVLTAVTVLVTLNKAIMLCQPISYEV